MKNQYIITNDDNRYIATNGLMIINVGANNICLLSTYQCLAQPTLAQATVRLGGAFDAKNFTGVGELVTTLNLNAGD